MEVPSGVAVTGIKADITNKRTGGSDSGATDFTLTNGEHAVTKIQVWTDTGCGDWANRDLVKDIELTWANGDTSNITGNHSGGSVDFKFSDNEKVSSMTLRTGNRVDKISFTTDKKQNGNYRVFDAGQSNGTEHKQSVGNGIFLGFIGTYDSKNNELISIGAKFKN